MEGYVRGVEVSFNQPAPYEWQWWRGNVEGRVSGLEATWHSLRCSHRMLLGAGTKMIQRNSVLKGVFFVSAQDSFLCLHRTRGWWLTSGERVKQGEAEINKANGQFANEQVFEGEKKGEALEDRTNWRLDCPEFGYCILWIFRHSHTGRGRSRIAVEIEAWHSRK